MNKQIFGKDSEDQQGSSSAEIRHPNSKQNNWQIFSHSHKWYPPTDVFETPEEIILRVEISGMDGEDIDITVNKNVITISGNRADNVKDKIAYHQMEVNFGEFTTSVEINTPIQMDKAEAKYLNGMLIVKIPKAKQISISINK